MKEQQRYQRLKESLLTSESICPENRKPFTEFFDFEEYKLKRKNGLPALDGGCYKTLIHYTFRFRNANRWFENKPWTDLTREDIKCVYDGLEDGDIKTSFGRPVMDRESYYSKVFKSKPFKLADKDELAKEVIEYYRGHGDKQVRYLTEEEFRKLTSVLANSIHLLLFWLAWDIGENINTLLQLTKRELTRQINPDTGDAEYLVRLPKVILKRSRTPRSEPTLYPETILLRRHGAEPAWR